MKILKMIAEKRRTMSNKHDYDMIATPNISMTGAVHASGECYVTVKRQHGGSSENPPITVSGSVHGIGNSSVDVEDHRERSDQLPEPADDAKGFVSMVDGEVRESGNVHDGGAMTVHIGRLVVFPHGNANMIVALYNDGYDVYDSIDFNGSVHAPGRLNVTIDDLYVY